MCGITGFIDFTHQSNYNDLTRMTDALIHRGPDDSGYNLFKTDHALIGLGHRRLSILDLSPLGHQPMKFEHLFLVLKRVFNTGAKHSDFGHWMRKTEGSKLHVT
jgi:asparagine synthase (glutamine-hydrolysing)